MTTLSVADDAVEASPSLGEITRYVEQLGKPTAAQVLAETRARGGLAVQPRCGVGSHQGMTDLLTGLAREADPDLLTITIDAHTRLLRFEQARRALEENPADLNGYPLVTHGWERGRELNECVAAPLEIRHGSPDARLLFATALASGITSFEGGGISYNLPYSKDVPLAESLEAWRQVDAMAGDAARHGLIIDREMFGTLTAVLVPPSISLATGVLEAALAAREGVRCVSISYPQGGHLAQDVAALRAIGELAARYLPAGVEVHPVLHEFMGVFPKERANAEQLIFFGALTARLGGATKIITKTYQEAFGIPDTAANAAGLRLAKIADSALLGEIQLDEEAVAREQAWIVAEVVAMVDPILERTDPYRAVADAFADGRLDIPFSASRHAQSAVIPGRDPEGAIRYVDAGELSLPDGARSRDAELLERDESVPLIAALTDDVNHFPRLFGEHSEPASA